MSAPANRGYLLDTNVLSALAPDRPDVSPDLGAWLRAHSEQLYIPCIAVAELEQGIQKLRRAGGSKRAGRLAAWMNSLLSGYAERVLPLDGPVCKLAGQIAERAVAAGNHPGFPDVAIAAIAQYRDLTILTGNLRHFQALGVRCADPFERLPK